MIETFTVLPPSPMRKMIAVRTAEANRAIPHFRLRADIEVDALSAFRKAQKNVKLSMTDVLVKACADSLMHVPALNLQWVEGEIRQLNSADITVVVALEEGLSTPIIRSADRKGIQEISVELKELTQRAKGNLLKTADIFGGSFSISNLGMFGVPEFDAIINPPQCAILAVGAARSMVIPDGALGIRIASMLRVTLSCDHRAVDGATGARFLSILKRILETPARLEQLIAGDRP